MSEAPSNLERRVARHVVTQYLKVRPGENVIIESWQHTLSLASAVLDEVRCVGGEVLFVYDDEDSWWRAVDRGQTDLLGRSSAPEWAALKAADVYVNFWGPSDTDRMEKLPDSADDAFDWMGSWYDVARKTGLRGVRMTQGFATERRARQWGVDRAWWEDRLLRASLADPEEMSRRAARLSKALAGGKRVRITHSNGTDLEVALVGARPRAQVGRPRPWTKGNPGSGMIMNVPVGSVDVLLDSKTAEGQLRANRRTNIWWNWHAGGALRFAGGRLSSYALEAGEKVFTRQFRRGSTGRDRASALTFGLNAAVRDVPNLEKCELGSVSVQLGGNSGLGGTNASTFFTWFTLAGGEIQVDDRPVVRAGRIL